MLEKENCAQEVQSLLESGKVSGKDLERKFGRALLSSAQRVGSPAERVLAGESILAADAICRYSRFKRPFHLEKVWYNLLLVQAAHGEWEELRRHAWHLCLRLSGEAPAAFSAASGLSALPVGTDISDECPRFGEAGRALFMVRAQSQWLRALLQEAGGGADGQSQRLSLFFPALREALREALPRWLCCAAARGGDAALLDACAERAAALTRAALLSNMDPQSTWPAARAAAALPAARGARRRLAVAAGARLRDPAAMARWFSEADVAPFALDTAEWDDLLDDGADGIGIVVESEDLVEATAASAGDASDDAALWAAAVAAALARGGDGAADRGAGERLRRAAAAHWRAGGALARALAHLAAAVFFVRRRAPPAKARAQLAKASLMLQTHAKTAQAAQTEAGLVRLTREHLLACLTAQLVRDLRKASGGAWAKGGEWAAVLRTWLLETLPRARRGEHVYAALGATLTQWPEAPERLLAVQCLVADEGVEGSAEETGRLLEALICAGTPPERAFAASRAGRARAELVDAAAIAALQPPRATAAARVLPLLRECCRQGTEAFGERPEGQEKLKKKEEEEEEARRLVRRWRLLARAWEAAGDAPAALTALADGAAALRAAGVLPLPLVRAYADLQMRLVVRTPDDDNDHDDHDDHDEQEGTPAAGSAPLDAPPLLPDSWQLAAAAQCLRSGAPASFWRSVSSDGRVAADVRQLASAALALGSGGGDSPRFNSPLDSRLESRLETLWSRLPDGGWRLLPRLWRAAAALRRGGAMARGALRRLLSAAAALTAVEAPLAPPPRAFAAAERSAAVAAALRPAAAALRDALMASGIVEEDEEENRAAVQGVPMEGAVSWVQLAEADVEESVQTRLLPRLRGGGCASTALALARALRSGALGGRVAAALGGWARELCRLGCALPDAQLPRLWAHFGGHAQDEAQDDEAAAAATSCDALLLALDCALVGGAALSAPEGVQTARRALRLAERSACPRRLAQALRALAHWWRAVGAPFEARHYLKEARRWAERYGRCADAHAAEMDEVDLLLAWGKAAEAREAAAEWGWPDDDDDDDDDDDNDDDENNDENEDLDLEALAAEPWDACAPRPPAHWWHSCAPALRRRRRALQRWVAFEAETAESTLSRAADALQRWAALPGQEPTAALCAARLARRALGIAEDGRPGGRALLAVARAMAEAAAASGDARAVVLARAVLRSLQPPPTPELVPRSTRSTRSTRNSGRKAATTATAAATTSRTRRRRSTSLPRTAAEAVQAEAEVLALALPLGDPAASRGALQAETRHAAAWGALLPGIAARQRAAWRQLSSSSFSSSPSSSSSLDDDGEMESGGFSFEHSAFGSVPLSRESPAALSAALSAALPGGLSALLCVVDGGDLLLLSARHGVGIGAARRCAGGGAAVRAAAAAVERVLAGSAATTSKEAVENVRKRGAKGRRQWWDERGRLDRELGEALLDWERGLGAEWQACLDEVLDDDDDDNDNDGDDGDDDGGQPRALVLVLDSELQMLPWESLPRLRSRGVSRMPSLGALIERCRHGGGGGWPSGVRAGGAFFVVNPSGDLQRTQDFFEGSTAFGGWRERWGWSGVFGAPPSPEAFADALFERGLVVYGGHNTGQRYLPKRALDEPRPGRACAAVLLMGCSSGRLSGGGEFEPQGAALSFLAAGAPCVVGNLWDVTDADIDRFSIEMMERWLERQEPDLGMAVAAARETCKLPFLVGAAPIIYGIPPVILDDD